MVVIAALDQNCIVLAKEIRFPFQQSPSREWNPPSNMQRLLAREGAKKNVCSSPFPYFDTALSAEGNGRTLDKLKKLRR
uniref:Uncharacterized protein n=1 Tax=Vespula pensylvanica TaxID=30213 RepID=A0A834UEL2_VESPE|nr:hypothetical protein H0235_003079 [Vespula pensylvanica]